jgi:hypothetical protein
VDSWIWANVTVAARLAALVDSNLLVFAMAAPGGIQTGHWIVYVQLLRGVWNEVELQRYEVLQLPPRLVFGTGGLHPLRRKSAARTLYLFPR